MTGRDPLTSSSSQGNGLATMLLGWGSSGEMDIDYPTATSSGYFGVYVQDDWRVSSKLTLNLGFRYDFDIPRTERFDRLNWFDFNAVSPLAGKVPGYPNLKGLMRYADSSQRTPYDGDYNNIQPRIGIAYALGKKMSVRAGYGIYYSVSRASIKGEIGSAFRSGSSLQFSRDSNFTQYATLQNPFPTGLTMPPGPTKDPLSYIGLGFDSYDPKTVNPQILTFSAGYPIVPQLDSPDLLSGDQRPNIVGDPRTTGSPSQRINQYFNVDAFSQPDTDVYGNAPRTLPNYRTFGVRNGDLTLMKNFRFTESKYAQFRIEAFNMTNTPIFGRPNEAYGSDTFGQITGYASGCGPRQLQLAIKFYY